MDDLISRQAAIEEIERWLGYIDDDMVRRMQIGMKRLPSAQPEPHWIPVTERLPEKFKNVIVTSRGGVSMAWYNGIYFEKGASTKHRAMQTVKAWMPLPEVWKG